MWLHRRSTSEFNLSRLNVLKRASLNRVGFHSANSTNRSNLSSPTSPLSSLSTRSISFDLKISIPLAKLCSTPSSLKTPFPSSPSRVSRKKESWTSEMPLATPFSLTVFKPRRRRSVSTTLRTEYESRYPFLGMVSNVKRSFLKRSRREKFTTRRIPNEGGSRRISRRRMVELVYSQAMSRVSQTPAQLVEDSC